MELNRIYCEDNLATMARMPDGFIDLVVTSPPYDNLRTYNGYSWDFEKVAQELYRVVKKGGVVVWVVGDATINGSETGTSFRQALYFKGVGFNLETMIYEQAGTGAKGSNYYYWQSFEFVFILAKGQPITSNRIADVKNTNGGKLRPSFNAKADSLNTRTERTAIVSPFYSVRGNVWRYAMGQNDPTDHPAPFPEHLAGDHILSWSNEGDLVYDCFCGSGTVPKMAHLLRRNWIGSEISQEYVELANKRLEPYLAQSTLF